MPELNAALAALLYAVGVAILIQAYLDYTTDKGHP